MPDSRLIRAYRVAIVGVGPKGTYAYERLAAHLRAATPPLPVEIHLFEQSGHFGAGRIYQPGQPDYLVMNFALGNIDLWPGDGPPPVVPTPQPMQPWLATTRQGTHGADAFVPRSWVGQYLQAGFQAITAHLPGNTRAVPQAAQVVDLLPTAEGYQVHLSSESTPQPVPFHQVLLATGHPAPSPDDALAAAGARFVPFPYPLPQQLETIPPRATVGFRGLGLTFIDAALALTEGRGGRFVATPDGLRYLPTGAEPARLVPYARRGLPMLPRQGTTGLPTTTTPLAFTTDTLAALRATAPETQWDFERDLWPLLQQDMVRAFNAAAPPAPMASPLTGNRPFSPALLLDPLAPTPSATPEAHHQFVVAYLRASIAAAGRGATADPWAAAAAVWQRALPTFRRAYRQGGLTPASHRHFHQHGAGALNRLAFGPPIENAWKVLALAEAGLLDFRMSRQGRARWCPDQGRFRLTSLYTRSETLVDYLIDARIPRVRLSPRPGTLYHNLYRRGLATPFVNRDPATDTAYAPGCLALDLSGRVLGEDGRPQPGLSVTGTPTEGVFYDNDSLARGCNDVADAWAQRVVAAAHAYEPLAYA